VREGRGRGKGGNRISIPPCGGGRERAVGRRVGDRSSPGTHVLRTNSPSPSRGAYARGNVRACARARVT